MTNRRVHQGHVVGARQRIRDDLRIAQRVEAIAAYSDDKGGALEPAKRPAHAMDMLWSNASPMQVHYGDQDPIMPPELLADLRARLARWGVEHEVCIYPGANHAFSAPAPHMHHAEATAASWEATVRFLRPKLGLRGG